MANILGLITVNDKEILEVDAIPSAGLGTPAPMGSEAMFDDGSNTIGGGQAYIKIGPADVDWDRVLTVTNSGVQYGDFLHLALYNTDANGNRLADNALQNAKAIEVVVVPQPNRAVDINYQIPNPGDSIAVAQFILDQGNQSIFGVKTFQNNTIFNGDVAINGTLTYVNSTVMDVTDKVISLNMGGLAGSGSNVGFQISEGAVNASVHGVTNATAAFQATEPGASGNGHTVQIIDSGSGGFRLVSDSGSAAVVDLGGAGSQNAAAFNALAGLNSVIMTAGSISAAEGPLSLAAGLDNITGYFESSADRNGFLMKAPNVAFQNQLDLSNLSADRVQHFANTNGTFAMRPDGTPFVAKQIAYGQDANNLVSEAGFEYDPGTNTLTVPNATISGLGLGVVHSSAGGVLSSSPVVLTSEVSGILPIANGGTNASTALNNGRLMYSNGGSIVEYSAMVPAQVYFGAATTGLPAQDISLYWDNVNKRLGIDGSGSPSRSLDVNGNAIIQGAFKIANSALTKANIEWKQAEIIGATGAAYQTIATLAIPSNSEVLVEVRVMGLRTGGSAGSAQDAAAYVRTCRFKSVGATVSQFDLQTDYTSEDQKPWDATITAAGLVQVRGAANNTVNWTATYSMQVIS